MDCKSENRASLFDRFLRILNDPSPERYSAFIQLRRFGRGATSQAEKTGRHKSDGARPSDDHAATDVDAYVKHAV